MIRAHTIPMRARTGALARSDAPAIRAPYVIAIATLCFVVLVLSIALAVAVIRP